MAVCATEEVHKDCIHTPHTDADQTRIQTLLNCTIRHRGDSNPCGQSPMDFESISLAARTQCLCMISMNRQSTNQMRGWKGGLGVGVYNGGVSGFESDLHLYVAYICNPYEPHWWRRLPWRRVCVCICICICIYCARVRAPVGPP